MAENIGFIAKNRTGKRGGGFNKSILNIKEFKIASNKYEMVCGIGSSTTSNTKVALIAIYVYSTVAKSRRH